jgi:hypothetical protein
MPSENKQIFPLHWNGIDIEVSYDPNWSPAYFEIYGEHMAHLECRTIVPEKARLPITETGYKSHFAPTSVFDNEGGPVAFIQKWLDSEAQSREWLDYLEEQRQPSLFDF